MSAEGEDLFDDFLNSRLEDDSEHGGGSVKLNANDGAHHDTAELNDEEFEKLLNESETEPHHQQSELATSTTQQQPTVNVSSTESSSSNTTTVQQQTSVKDQNTEDEDDGEVIEFQWTDEDQIKDETDQAKQNELISKISTHGAPKRKRSTASSVTGESSTASSSATTTRTTDSSSTGAGGNHHQEIVEARISLMISDILNRFGKVIDIDSRGEAIEMRMTDLRKEETESSYSFAKLKESLQRKLVVLECTIDNLCTLIDRNVQRKTQLREAKKLLKDQLVKTSELCSEKSKQLEETKEKYKKMEAIYQKDRNNLLQIIETLKSQINDPENEVVKNLKIPEDPNTVLIKRMTLPCPL
ncbi:hypothetical protein C9374_007598 [Naegleria lovaniensis]|uniref:Uncharacterized protein n=1 Tax=Naegleria lovaniensis TaxID=51637 RepID=A0AA88GL40_NAELO|nr:uncharacterized protein C9374_007598 [Naegleria lovaniensis]KAG2378960.1 hypothetical protein C9374_007598 [Naegleria lovaniensis]